MKQLAQRLRDGAMSVIDVPRPKMGPGMVLVENHFSLISPGTEGSTVATARKSLLGKARERPQQVRQVLDVVVQQGPLQAYRAVQKKLEAYSPLGYTSAGIVVDAAPDVYDIHIGDKVACAGVGYASHAELVAVPRNLCVPLPREANLESAAYNALGAIAMQGVRQADLRLGETCVVLGLGLLGQLTGLILRASGVRVIATDISPPATELAARHFADDVFISGQPGGEAMVSRHTRGIGADAVIITAATESRDPINLAGRVLRKRGTVVLVGVVSTAFDRDPDFYRKELVLKMSCSYGPGRYDPVYEEQGRDYPAGFVRWTENRNMEAFQNLVHAGRLDVGYLTTHRFALDDATRAYDLILAKTEPHLGIVIDYGRPVATAAAALDQGPVPVAPKISAAAGPGVSFIGAGSYALSHLLPNLPGGDVARRGIVTATGASARSVAERHGFAFCGTDMSDVLNDTDTSVVFIATRHDSHAGYVRAAVRAGKHVFVEKPLAITPAELESLREELRQSDRMVMVGFNRRFSPLVRAIKKDFGNGPMAFVYRINAGAIPSDSWIQDPALGGGRVIGEICHFIDTLLYLAGSPVAGIHAVSMPGVAQTPDTVAISLQFQNGSIGSIAYYANGPKRMPKEYLEVYKDGRCAQLVDFRELVIHGADQPKRQKLFSQDKGQAEMVRQFIGAVARGSGPPIPVQELFDVTAATFRVMDSLRMAEPVTLTSGHRA